MSVNQIADFVTGQLLPSGSDAVALVIGTRMTGHERRASVGVSPSHLFEALSLPIFGTTGEYTEFLPVVGDPAVRLVLSRTEFEAWERFTAKGFGLNGSIKIDMERGEEGLGLAVMARSTFDLACDFYRGRAAWMADVDEAVEVVLHARARYMGEDGVPSDFGAMRLMSRNGFVFTDGRRVDNRLLGVLAEDDDHGPVSRTLRRLLHDGRGILDYGSAVDAETLRSLIELLQAQIAIVNYLEARNRYIVPSPSARPDRSYNAAIAIAIDDVDLALGHALAGRATEEIGQTRAVRDGIARLNDITSAAADRCDVLDAAADAGPAP